MYRTGESELVCSANELSKLLGRDWNQTHSTLTGALVSAIANLIATEILPSGARLPAQRRLSDALGISRTTVAAAYRDLVEAGSLDARQGGYTRVSAGRVPAAASSSLRRLAENDLFANLVSTAPMINFVESGHVISDAMRQTMPGPETLDFAARGHGYHPRGAHRLRLMIARALSADGLPTTPDNLLLTNGAQQATDLAFRYWLRFGGVIATEDPNYAGLLDLVKLTGAIQIPLVVSTSGIDLSRLASELDGGRRLSLVYVTPDSHNPTGTTMSVAQRRELIDLAVRHRLPIVENLSMRGIAAPAEHPRLASLAPDAVISIGSFSGLYWPGLRVGWLRGPSATVDALALIRAVTDLGGAVLNQLWAADMMAHEAAVVEALHQEYASKHARVRSLIHDLLPDWKVTSPPTCAWLWVDTGVDVAELRRVVAGRGVNLADPRTWSLTGSSPNMLRIPLGYSFDVLAEGLSRVAEISS